VRPTTIGGNDLSGNVRRNIPIDSDRRPVNYIDTFIAVAPDTRATPGTVPPERGGGRSVAALEYELISAQPYTLTQEDVQFAVYVQRQGIPAARLAAERAGLWDAFFSQPMACMRSSPLPKSYGWGLHFDGEGRVALVAMESPDYERLSTDQTIDQTRACAACGPEGRAFKERPALRPSRSVDRVRTRPSGRAAAKPRRRPAPR
jgi:Family of unknown function (DUF6157)